MKKKTKMRSKNARKTKRIRGGSAPKVISETEAARRSMLVFLRDLKNTVEPLETIQNPDAYTKKAIAEIRGMIASTEQQYALFVRPSE